MALPTSGQLDINAIHVEAGGTSGSACTINDSDIRALVSASSGSAMDFADWYGASSEDTSLTFSGSTNSGNGIGYKGFTGGSPSQSFGSISDSSFTDQSTGATRTLNAFYQTTETSGKVTNTFVHIILDTGANASSFSSMQVTRGASSYTFTTSSADIANNTTTFSGRHYWRWQMGLGIDPVVGTGTNTVTVS